MKETANTYDNAHAELVNGILRTEFLLNEILQTVQDAQRTAQEAIETYNNLRPHLRLGL